MRPLLCAIALSACASSRGGSGSTTSGSESSSSAAADTTSTATTQASSEASTAADTGTTGDESTSGSTTGEPACVLEESGPITVSRDGQVIERMHVVSTDGPAIVVDGFANVVIRDVWIEHAGGPGVAISGADDLVIDHVAIEHTGAPESGANPSDGLINLSCYASARLAASEVRLVRGSSGAYLLECPDATLSRIEGHDFRGPFPRGQLVQLDKSDGVLLEDFSVVNPPGSWPEDNVNIYQSIDATIRRGLIDGNNSPSGVGVIFDGDMALGVVEDVDAIRMGNGCFSDYAGSDGVVFRRTRCRENICEDQGRGPPLSNALMWTGHEGFTQIVLEDSHWFASCNGNLVWPEESFATLELDEQDFTLRDPIVADFCWE
jgi:hypothetical protein